MMSIKDLPFQIISVEKTEHGFKITVVIKQVYNKHTGDREQKIGRFETNSTGMILKTPHGFNSDYCGTRLHDLQEYVQKKV